MLHEVGQKEYSDYLKGRILRPFRGKCGLVYYSLDKIITAPRERVNRRRLS